MHVKMTILDHAIATDSIDQDLIDVLIERSEMLSLYCIKHKLIPLELFYELLPDERVYEY